MDGSLSKALKRWRSEIVKLAASLEAYIDFGESDDIEVKTMGTNVACSEANFKRIGYLFCKSLEKKKLFPNSVFRLFCYPSPAWCLASWLARPASSPSLTSTSPRRLQATASAAGWGWQLWGRQTRGRARCSTCWRAGTQPLCRRRRGQPGKQEKFNTRRR